MAATSLTATASTLAQIGNLPRVDPRVRRVLPAAHQIDAANLYFGAAVNEQTTDVRLRFLKSAGVDQAGWHELNQRVLGFKLEFCDHAMQRALVNGASTPQKRHLAVAANNAVARGAVAAAGADTAETGRDPVLTLRRNMSAGGAGLNPAFHPLVRFGRDVDKAIDRTRLDIVFHDIRCIIGIPDADAQTVRVITVMDYAVTKGSPEKGNVRSVLQDFGAFLKNHRAQEKCLLESHQQKKLAAAAAARSSSLSPASSSRTGQLIRPVLGQRGRGGAHEVGAARPAGRV